MRAMLLEPLLWLIAGHLTTGNGPFEEVATNSRAFSGSGGYAISLIHALPCPTPAAMKTLESYQRLPQYLAAEGDAGGDAFTNRDEYFASFSAEQYCVAALDPTLCGAQPIDGGEGEGEGEGNAEDP